MKFDPILDYDEADSEFEPYFRIVQTKVIDSYLWYKDHTTTPRLCFRITGATVILFSITIPAVSAYSFPHKNITIALMALVIAIFSGLNTFFKWGEKWQSFIRSELAIKHLIGLWQIEMRNAKCLENEIARSNSVSEATKILLEEVGNIVSQETEDYFSKVQWPKKQS